MNKRRLKKLANFLDTLEESKFDIRSFTADDLPVGCGSTACAMGWCPVLFPRICYSNSAGHPRSRKGEAYGTYGAMIELFDLTISQIDDLFFSGGYSEKMVTAKMVAAKIRLLIVQ